MGSPESEMERRASEGPQHRVTTRHSFYLGKFEVTRAQWQAVMGKDPSLFGRSGRPLNILWRNNIANLPVENISWDDCQEFCRRLSLRTAATVRLPREAEWEYACRAGTTTPYSFGETVSTDEANYDGDYVYGNGQRGPNRAQPMPVGSFTPNAWGIYDMHGNVCEFCDDQYHESYVGAPRDGSSWLSGGLEGYRVLRGGSWFSVPSGCRSASRSLVKPSLRRDCFGLRVVVDPSGIQ